MSMGFDNADSVNGPLTFRRNFEEKKIKIGKNITTA